LLDLVLDDLVPCLVICHRSGQIRTKHDREGAGFIKNTTTGHLEGSPLNLIVYDKSRDLIYCCTSSKRFAAAQASVCLACIYKKSQEKAFVWSKTCCY